MSPSPPAGARSHPTLLAIAALCLAAAPAAAQEPPARPAADGGFGGEVAVTVVNLEVMVRGRDGRPLEGLTAADFRILQGGVERPISNFSAYSPTAATAPADLAAEVVTTRPSEPPPSLPAMSPVSVLLFVDSANLHPLQRNRVLDRVQTFVRDHLSPPVRMAVVTSDPSLTVQQPFTHDSAGVIAALEQASRTSGGRFVRDVERQRILEWLHVIGNDRRAMLLEFTDQPDVILAKAQVQGRITSWIQEETFAVRDAVSRLRQAVQLVAGLEGRRVILYISSGLPLTPGAGLLHQFSSVFRDTTVFSRVPQISLADDFRSLAVAANREGVSLYSIEAGGLNPLEGFTAGERSAPGAMTGATDLADQQGSLRYLADTTGGLAVVNSNDPTAGLMRVAEDLESWYSIGYTLTSAGGEDVAHRLEVELPDHPDATIRCRRWFVEASLDTRLLDLVSGQLAEETESNPMELRLSFGPSIPGSGSHRILPLKLSVPLRHLPLVREGEVWVAELEVCVAVQDDQGRRSTPSLQPVTVRVPVSGYDPSREQRFAVELQLALRDQEHLIAAGVLERGSGVISATRVRTPPP